jgi:hypothetical protein
MRRAWALLHHRVAVRSATLALAGLRRAAATTRVLANHRGEAAPPPVDAARTLSRGRKNTIGASRVLQAATWRP